MLVYALALREGRYYVGSTSRRIRTRFDEHTAGRGSAWTRMYAPLRVVYSETVASGSSVDARLREDALTKQMMLAHGIENVRGGTHSQVELSAAVVQTLTQEVAHGEGACLRCGRMSHFASGCYAKTHVNGTCIRSDDGRGGSDRSGSGSSAPQQATWKRTGAYAHRECKRQRVRNERCCSRCGRSSHAYEDCFASRDVDGNDLSCSDAESDDGDE